MADPILQFPRVVIKTVDPTTSDDASKGFIPGNMWVNRISGEIFVCIDGPLGKWTKVVTSGGDVNVSDIAIGDDDANIEIHCQAPDSGGVGSGGGTFRVLSDNFCVFSTGVIHSSGNQLVFGAGNDQIANPENADGIIKVFRSQDNGSQQLGWFEDLGYWGMGPHRTEDLSHPFGERGTWPITSYVVREHNPNPGNCATHYIGQHWLNYVTQEVFVCVDIDYDANVATWRSTMPMLPIKYQVESDDYIILYGGDDDTYARIHVTHFVNYVASVITNLIDPPDPYGGYAWTLDVFDSLMPSQEASGDIVEGLFEPHPDDPDNEMTPIMTGLSTVVVTTKTDGEPYFEIVGDIDGDINPVEPGVNLLSQT